MIGILPVGELFTSVGAYLGNNAGNELEVGIYDITGAFSGDGGAAFAHVLEEMDSGANSWFGRLYRGGADRGGQADRGAR